MRYRIEDEFGGRFSVREVDSDTVLAICTTRKGAEEIKNRMNALETELEQLRKERMR